MPPRVALIILCYNGLDDTLACLRSLARLDYPRDRYEVVIVDNASSDGTPQAVRAAFPTAKVIETGANLGFAAGNNAGIRYALEQDHDYVLLLNNDTEVAADFLQILVDAAESDPAIGVVGPTIYYYERPDLIWSAGGLIDWWQGTSRMYTDKLDINPHAVLRDVDFVTGCALLCKRTALERAGLLDERFFMYYEETEWCVRIARAGFRIAHVHGATVLHKIPLNARFDKEYLAYYMTRNRLLFLRATGVGLTTWLNALLLQDLRTYLSLCFRPKWRKRSGREGMRRAWMDFWRGRFGMLQGGQ
ncbi:MAG: glycosyltransferase family 2 protein [Chloroflexales bacterium]|nr:glycosyltransferase family 2 protein [Chloroflexales bacterium]